MLVTIEQAAKLWCPWARVTQISGGQLPATDLAATANRGDGLSAGTDCIADQCMAFRWMDSEEQGDDRRGYCGNTRL